MTKYQAEKDRDKAVAWSRAKNALHEFLRAADKVGPESQRKQAAVLILAFIEGFEGMELHL